MVCGECSNRRDQRMPRSRERRPVLLRRGRRSDDATVAGEIAPDLSLANNSNSSRSASIRVSQKELDRTVRRIRLLWISLQPDGDCSCKSERKKRHKKNLEKRRF